MEDTMLGWVSEKSAGGSIYSSATTDDFFFSFARQLLLLCFVGDGDFACGNRAMRSAAFIAASAHHDGRGGF
ncbi:hypothetical protein HZU75_14710 [Chitinibacter fontanus]|uniref:Uncharacterized protein n=1 Tax=Chitinibacter fontanus TaxID=1737446 RepID=A0A7D5VBE2_9NEIS|nr:hypothetical protein [Chitinibacter fontanus]QLI82676.1 hypothetical protein HZU75_14710 [Chitinibacter fontanus]